ncbi:ATP-binding protein [Hwangdonia lutea]|uniref:histidine kinase n=1 Tax=Hwangdonia lutea TaxID=3075823 RepID=A0AA97HNT1_9FLAO|nr:ATP-binding protein [Hwangdonia sp. SCSIO 19198]WOD42361.1 ATP-binding protein [Hwangdonia sp. SCSIO 19198]
MKTNLLVSFLLVTTLVFGKTDREIIKEIDQKNASALILFNNQQIVKSFKEFIHAKALSDSIQDNYGSATANFHLGNIYYLMENYKSAQEHYQLTLDVLKELDDDYLVSSSFLNLAKIFRDQNKYNKSIEYFEKALQFSVAKRGLQTAEKENLQNIYVEAKINLCELYIEKNSLDEALINLLKLGNYLKTNSVNSSLEGYFNYVYGIYYAKKELYNNASNKFREAIFSLNEHNEEVDLALMSDIYMQLSIALAKSGKSTEAYITLLEQNNYKDQLSNEEKNRHDLILKSKFLIEDYKNEAKTANIARLEQMEIANKFKKINIIFFITLLLLVVSFIVIYKSYSSKIKLSKTLKLKNNELQLAKDEALKTSELKSKFISNVSHELRTPLYGVVGITSLLLNERKNLSERDRKYLQSLKYSGDYLLNLVNDILQANKMEAQKIELKNVSVNLKSLMQRIVDSFEYRLQESNNIIKLSIDEEIPEYIKVDKVRMSQVLLNLIGNSIKFTESGVIDLRIKLLNLDEEKVSLRFEIEDNGIGIPEDKFKTIFDNFSQLGNENNTNYQGTGLGLSITQNIIQLFESQIELESEVGKGTKFSFNIDFEIDQESKTVVDLNAPKKVKLNKGNKYKILIVEDNKINQIVTKNLLVKQNYACDIVDNGLKAVEIMKAKNSYDLILMDINMPVMNGNDATVAIRQFNKEIPIIALTAADIEEVKQDFDIIGFNDIITKPFDNYEFFQTIASHIQNSNSCEVKLVKAS